MRLRSWSGRSWGLGRESAEVVGTEILGLLLTRPPELPKDTSIFGFAEFLAALVLMVLVFNASDARYRFRTAIAPFPLMKIAYIAIPFLGIGTLLNDLWFSERRYGLPFGVSEAAIGGIFATLFMSIYVLWLWVAFIRPPVFSVSNAEAYAKAVYRILAKASKPDLEMLADELQRSAKPLVSMAEQYGRPPSIGGNSTTIVKSKKDKATSAFADDVLQMMADKALCKEIVAQSPLTAMTFMSQARQQNKLTVLLGDFARPWTHSGAILV
jgi:hypothetical protein